MITVKRLTTPEFTAGLPPELRIMSLKGASHHKDVSINRSIEAAKAFRTELSQAHDTYHLSNTSQTVEPLVQHYREALGNAKNDAGQLLDMAGEPHPDDQIYLAKKLERSVETAKNLRQTIFPGPSVSVRKEPELVSMPLSREKQIVTDKDPIELHINGIETEKEKKIYKHLHDDIKDGIRSLNNGANSLPIKDDFSYSDKLFVERPKNKISSEQQVFLSTLYSKPSHNRNLVRQNPDLLQQILERVSNDENSLASGETTPRARPTTPNLLRDEG
jgi:hypothetical protein